MTLVSDIIQQAYREGNIIPVGASPGAGEATEALSRLNSLISGFYGAHMGELLSDWMVPQPQRTATVSANYPQATGAAALPSSVTSYPPKNKRLVWTGGDMSVWFPEKPDDGSRMALVQGSGGAAGAVLTLDGNGRMIAGSSTQTFTNPVTAQQWLYRADLGDWLAVTTLLSTDDMVFPSDMDDLWIGLLAMRLSARYNKTLSPGTLHMVKQAQAAARARFKQSQDSVFGGANIPTTTQSFSEGGDI